MWHVVTNPVSEHLCSIMNRSPCHGVKMLLSGSDLSRLSMFSKADDRECSDILVSSHIGPRHQTAFVIHSDVVFIDTAAMLHVPHNPLPSLIAV